MPDSQTGAESPPDPPTAGELVERVLDIARNVATRPPDPPTDWSRGEGALRLRYSLREAGVPSRYGDARLDAVRPRRAIEEYLSDLRANVAAGHGLLLSGPTGTGKSSIAALICAECVKAEISVRWAYVPDLVDGLSRIDARAEVMRSQVLPDLLVWDDLGVGGLYDWQLGLLDRVVENRYRRRKPMIVTTNLKVDVLRNEDALERFVDRWRQTCKLVRCEGESMRHGL